MIRKIPQIEVEYNMAWFFLVIASFGEIFGVMYINMYVRSKSLFSLFMIVLSMGLGFLFLSLAMRNRKSTRLNSSHVAISYAVFCLKKKKSQNVTIRIS